MEITVINLVLATAVLVVGVQAHRKTKSEGALFVGMAFGLFAVAHLLTLLGLAGTLSALLIAIRVLGYLAAMFGVYKIGTRS